MSSGNFDGDNTNFCNQICPYCYGGPKSMTHLWNGRVEDWTRAFERLNRDIYFNLSYGESMISKGFPEVVDIIGAHENWETSLITNLSVSPKHLIESKLGQDRRVYVHASWHPLGGRAANWENFTKHLLMLQEAEIPTVVMYLFYPPQIEMWKKYWSWLDAHNIRTCARRYIGMYEGKKYPESYSLEIEAFFKAALQPKSFYYGYKLKHTTGLQCTALMDMILVAYDGRVSYCADVSTHNLGNIFDPKFKLADKLVCCPSILCGGDYGMLHVKDDGFGSNPERLLHDCFVAQAENITGGGKERVNYLDRAGMEKWLLA